MGNAHRTMSDLRQKNAENEERMITLNKELHSGQELIKRLQVELNENVAQKEDQVRHATSSLSLLRTPMKHFTAIDQLEPCFM